MKTNLRLLSTAAVLLSLASAGGCAKREAAPAGPSASAAAPAGGAAKPGAPLITGRALVVTADLHVTVQDVDGASARVRAEVSRAGGYVADSSAHGKDDDRVATFQLRIPSDKLGDLRAALAGSGEVTADTEKVQDVTEERADLKARLGNARVQEKRVLEIMAQKTGTIAEVIDAERELARIRETVERLEAQERTLDGRIDLATVNVTLHAPSVVAWRTPGKSIVEAGRLGLHGAAAFFTYAAMLFVTVAPTLAPFAAIAIAIVVVTRRRRLRDEALLAGR